MIDAIPDHQFGFRRGHGTTEQCHRVVNYVKEAFEENKFCSAVFLDESQAFDKVWHVGLFYKMKKIVHPHLYKLLKSFIVDRTFYVELADSKSPSGTINSGVPQGSVLGPHLYNLYTSDIPECSQGLNGTFADDKAYLVKHESATEASHLLQLHLNDLEKWCKRWNINVMPR